MIRVVHIVSWFACVYALSAAQTSVIDKAGDLDRLLFAKEGAGRYFDLTVRVIAPTTPENTILVVEDDSGVAMLNLGPTPSSRKLSAGDMINISGELVRCADGRLMADCRPPRFIASGPGPASMEVSPETLLSGRCYGRFVRMSGTIIDAFQDEIDPTFVILILDCGGEKIYVTAKKTLAEPLGAAAGLIGREMSVAGVCARLYRGGMQFIGYCVRPYRKADMRLLTPQPDPFSVPELGDLSKMPPTGISALGRRQITGLVIAVYGKGDIMVKVPDGRVILANLVDADAPSYGDTVQVAGFPESNLFHVNLVRAIWRMAPPCEVEEDFPVPVTVRALVTDKNGQTKFDHLMHGHPVHLRGRVLSLPGAGGDDTRFYLQDENFMLPVEAGACKAALKDISVGCEVEVSGICAIESESWRPNSMFPHIKGMMVVMRTPEDIRVLAYPPWWTAGRLMAVIGALLGMLAGIFAWNRALNRRAERRGRELADEKVAHVASELKVEERTRLAVELHDSLAQNLSGVSLEIDTAAKLADTDATAMHEHLNRAARSLKSCRDELRNCLWDLRNRALEEGSMDEAIRQTLAPHLSGVEIALRFNVPRELLSDNTAHAILRIIRELALNAVHHGPATKLWIAGSAESAKLCFSVRDNGGGFNPASAPGFAEGHYGLVGISERVEAFEGEFTIESAPGKGCKATVSIYLAGISDPRSRATEI